MLQIQKILPKAETYKDCARFFLFRYLPTSLRKTLMKTVGVDDRIKDFPNVY